ncbi:hypothetical protein PybrP1_009323 [[Pythium] brassicae (nom. inval.)]|nr:hypothetical protein PybrP1_009323 [[Pythium] brassicae (nom. inval.)]
MASDEDDVSEEESESDIDNASGSSEAHSSSSDSGSGSDRDSERDSESNQVEDDSEDDEQELANAKRDRVQADVVELRRMMDEMEKVKIRLQFRLEREKQMRAEEAQWQQQQQQNAAAEEARQSVQHAMQELGSGGPAAKLGAQTNEGNQSPQRPLPSDSPARSLVEVAVQTEDERADVPMEIERQSASVQAAHSQRATLHEAPTSRTSSPTVPASEHPPARLSLFDLGRSYGMDEHGSDAPQQNHEPTASPTTTAERGGERAATAPPSDVSESETFFIRRDSARTSWQPEQPPPASRSQRLRATDSLLRSQGSVCEFDVDEQAPESPLPPSERSARASKSSFQALRNSILSSIYEAPNSAGEGTSSPRLASSVAPSSQPGEWKSEEQREQEAIRTLLFGR